MERRAQLGHTGKYIPKYPTPKLKHVPVGVNSCGLLKILQPTKVKYSTEGYFSTRDAAYLNDSLESFEIYFFLQLYRSGNFNSVIFYLFVCG